jgi:hypothetical protein
LFYSIKSCKKIIAARFIGDFEDEINKAHEIERLDQLSTIFNGDVYALNTINSLYVVNVTSNGLINPIHFFLTPGFVHLKVDGT